jgi:hypothetical protein
MPEFIDNDNLSDLGKLKAFVDFLHKDALEPIVLSGSDSKGRSVIPEELLSYTRTAWEELQKEGYFPRLKKEISNAREEDINRSN